jgi:hypothetical protein
MANAAAVAAGVDTVAAQAAGVPAVLAADVAGLRGGRLFFRRGGRCDALPPFFCDDCMDGECFLTILIFKETGLLTLSTLQELFAP